MSRTVIPDGQAKPTHGYRRLSDKILFAFHRACDQSDFEVAKRLLDILDMMARRPSELRNHRRQHDLDSLVAAHARLWHLRHANDDIDARSLWLPQRQRVVAK